MVASLSLASFANDFPASCTETSPIGIVAPPTSRSASPPPLLSYHDSHARHARKEKGAQLRPRALDRKTADQALQGPMLVPVTCICISIRSEEHTSELQSLMRNSYAVFCLKKKKQPHTNSNTQNHKR